MTDLPIGQKQHDHTQMGVYIARRMLKNLGHRSTSTGAVTKTPTTMQATARPRKGELWETRKFSPNDRPSFHREVAILSTISRLSSQTVHTPKIVSQDPRLGVLVLSYPRLRWATLAQRIAASEFGLDTLMQMKADLCCFIGLLCKSGIAYRFREDCVFPVKLASGDWALYLGGWKRVNFYPFSDRLDLAELEERQRKLEDWEAKQLENIERHFALLRTRATPTDGSEVRARDD